MRIHKNALNALIGSALVVLGALILTVLKLGMKFNYGAEATMAYLPLILGILAAAVVSFLFGWLRYSLAGGLTLGIAVLHDLLLSLALCAILSLVLGLSAYAPAFVLAGTAYTFCFTIPWLRSARKLARANNSRDFTREMAVRQALQQTRPLFILTVAVAALMLLAFLVSGNLVMAGSLLPLITGLLVAAVSARCIMPYLWASFNFRQKTRK